MIFPSQRQLLLPILLFEQIITAQPRIAGNGFKFLPEITSPRQEHSVAILDNQVYIAGGIGSNYSYTPDTLSLPATPIPVDLVQSYDIGNQIWHDRSPLPISINHGNIASVGDKIYMLGGLLGANLTLWGGIPNSYMYDPTTDIWTAVTAMPSHTERGACAVGVRGSEVFLAGGMRSLELSEGGLQDSVTLVSSYNTETNDWKTDYPPLPEARDHVGGAVIGSTFYVTGGRDHGQFNVRGDTWALDLDNPATGWRALAKMPTARGGLAVAAAGHCLYTFGGEGNPDSANGVFANVEVYNTKEDVWKQLPSLWAGIHGTNAATASSGIIYIPGGGYKLGAGASNFSVSYQPQEWCFD